MYDALEGATSTARSAEEAVGVARHLAEEAGVEARHLAEEAGVEAAVAFAASDQTLPDGHSTAVVANTSGLGNQPAAPVRSSPQRSGCSSRSGPDAGPREASAHPDASDIAFMGLPASSDPGGLAGRVMEAHGPRKGPAAIVVETHSAPTTIELGDQLAAPRPSPQRSGGSSRSGPDAGPREACACPDAFDNAWMEESSCRRVGNLRLQPGVLLYSLRRRLLVFPMRAVPRGRHGIRPIVLPGRAAPRGR